MYAVAFALFALWPVDERDGGLLASTYALGIGAVGLYVAIRMGATHGYREFFFQGRLDEPIGYTNADVALWTGAAWVALIFAGRRFIPIVAARPPARRHGPPRWALAVLGQSRGWFVVLPVMLILMRRPRAGPQPHGRRDGARRDRDRRSDRTAARRLPRHRLALLGRDRAADRDRGDRPRRRRLGAPRRHRGPSSAPRAGGVASASCLVVLFVLAGIGGVVAFTAVKGNPITRARRRLERIPRRRDRTEEHPATKYASAELGGTYRYDYWSVAFHQFLDHPIAGIGVDNFGREYLIHGTSYQTPTYPHSIELRTLAETGLIGALLLFGGIGAACVAAARRMRRSGVAGATTAAACLVGFAYFVIHGSIDWLWEYPALGAPALALLGLATTVGTAPEPALAGAAAGSEPARPNRDPPDRDRRRRPRRGAGDRREHGLPLALRTAGRVGAGDRLDRPGGGAEQARTRRLAQPPGHPARRNRRGHPRRNRPAGRSRSEIPRGAWARTGRPLRLPAARRARLLAGTAPEGGSAAGAGRRTEPARQGHGDRPTSRTRRETASSPPSSTR